MKAYLLGLTLLLTIPAQARIVKTLGDFTETEITRLDRAVNDGSYLESTESGGWTFKRFLLRIQGKVGFTIEVVGLELIPELELVWQKEGSI